MATLVLINIPLVRFINTDWYHTLVDTVPARWSSPSASQPYSCPLPSWVKLTQPIEYRR